MEFLALGKHCHICSQKDFLPFHCERCEGTFCLKHRSCNAHKCPEEHNNLDEVRQVTCPTGKVRRRVPIKEDQDCILAQHLSTCIAAPQTKTKKMSKKYRRPKCKKCKKRCLTRIECKDCHKPYCVPCLSQNIHECSVLKKREEEDNKSTKDTIQYLMALGGRAAQTATAAMQRKNNNDRMMARNNAPAVKSH